MCSQLYDVKRALTGNDMRQALHFLFNTIFFGLLGLWVALVGSLFVQKDLFNEALADGLLYTFSSALVAVSLAQNSQYFRKASWLQCRHLDRSYIRRSDIFAHSQLVWDLA